LLSSLYAYETGYRLALTAGLCNASFDFKFELLWWKSLLVARVVANIRGLTSQASFHGP
jgi:hypothetical protein